MVRRMELNCNTLVQYCINALGQSHVFIHYLGLQYPKDNLLMIYLVNACNQIIILCTLNFGK
jgi:hypothetical protein